MSPRDEEEPEGEAPEEPHVEGDGEVIDGERIDGESEAAGEEDEEDSVAAPDDDDEDAVPDEPGTVAPDAHVEVRQFLEALIEKGALVLVEGAKVQEVVPGVLKALARKDKRRAAMFLDALIDDDNVDEVFLDEDQVVKLIAAWF